jgi:hypothetical protein
LHQGTRLFRGFNFPWEQREMQIESAESSRIRTGLAKDCCVTKWDLLGRDLYESTIGQVTFEQMDDATLDVTLENLRTCGW